MTNILVIGGGPAGMTAAAFAAQNPENHIVLLEKNEKLGKKLFITGKGRCNLTNNADIEDYFANIPRNPKFLYSALYSFDNHALMGWMKDLGVPLKIERGGRVFPESDKSSDVLRALGNLLTRSGVDIRLNTAVDSLLLQDGCVCGVMAAGRELLADVVVVATGGVSYPKTGSTGDGHHFAQNAGHQIVPAVPALIPMETRENWPRVLQGLTLKNVGLRAYTIDGLHKKLCYSALGEMLFTHFGVSGPLILSASSHMDPQKEMCLSIDLKPGLSSEQLDARLLRDFEANHRKSFANALNALMPARLLESIVELSGIPPTLPVHQISKEQRKALGALLKDIPLSVHRFRPIEEAIITRGGVNVKEVNPGTLESKLIKGLHFVGEVLDVDALTGGFNLQIAFSTGHLAGQSIAKRA